MLDISSSSQLDQGVNADVSGAGRFGGDDAEWIELPN